MINNKAKKYNRIKLSVSLLNIFMEFMFWALLIYSGLHLLLAKLSHAQSSSIYLQFVIFLLVLGGIKLLIGLPLSFYSGFVVEHQFGLSNQRLWQWMWEQVKGLFLGIILGGIVLLVFYWLLVNFPESWWLFTWLFLMLFSVLLTRIAPTLIFPLFYKFTLIEREDIRNRIEQLAGKYGLKIEGVFRFNLSKSTKKANAAFTGLGKSKRVILGDTLLENFDLDEIEGVFAHEIGHFHKRHLIKGIVTNGLIMLLGLFIVSFFYAQVCTSLNYQVYRLEALPYLAFIFFFYSQITGPLGNYLSRRYEYEADNFAARNSSNPKAFITAMQKLSAINLADETPHPLVEFLFYSHPSISKRVANLTAILKIGGQ